MSSYRISQLADRTAFSPSTLRYYEQAGLLTAERTPGGYRSYSEADVRRLGFISRAKQLGLPLDGIRELVGVWEDGPCASVKARLEELLAARSKDVADRIRELAAFGADLARARDGLARATSRADADGGEDITFPADPDLAGRLAELAARERECCAFFAFALDMTAAGSITVRVRAPRGAGPLVAGLLGRP
jgi:DNA-binding transcriptional MerR regulator